MEAEAGDLFTCLPFAPPNIPFGIVLAETMRGDVGN